MIKEDVPKAEVELIMKQSPFVVEKNHEHAQNQNNCNYKAEMIQKQTPLNRISEEIVQSKDSVSTRGVKNERYGSNSKDLVNQQKPFAIQDSYNDCVNFEQKEQNQTDAKIEINQDNSLNCSELERAQSMRQKGQDQEEKERIKKLKKHKKLQKKLKQLEELEKIVKEKEQKTKKFQAIKTIQRWTRGHQARKKFDVIKHNICYFRKLRRLFSVSISKKQNKLIRNVIILLKKAAQEKIQAMKKEQQHQKKSKQKQRAK